MDARSRILAALPDAEPGPPPDWSPATDRADAPVEAFRRALEAAGGRLVVSADAPGADWLAGGPGVAESGAVWWVPRSGSERREAFLAERMLLRVARSELVPDLHEAYRRIARRGALPPFACFVSGPSKTADIEQALVIGAHGPRELVVWLAPDD